MRRVDLDGFGIRSLERFGNGYLIAAGPFGSEKSGFTLRRWTAVAGTRPEMSPQPDLANDTGQPMDRLVSPRSDFVGPQFMISFTSTIRGRGSAALEIRKDHTPTVLRKLAKA